MASKPFASGHDLTAADVNDLVGVINRSPTAVDVVSTTVETSLYQYSIPAGAMSTDRMLRLNMGGDILQNATATPTLKIQWYTGGVTQLWQSVLGLTPNDADRRPWNLELLIQNINSASVQRMDGRLLVGDVIPAAVGQGSQYGATGNGGGTIAIGGTGAQNTALACLLQITVVWDVSSANASFRKLQAALELL